MYVWMLVPLCDMDFEAEAYDGIRVEVFFVLGASVPPWRPQLGQGVTIYGSGGWAMWACALGRARQMRGAASLGCHRRDKKDTQPQLPGGGGYVLQSSRVVGGNVPPSLRVVEDTYPEPVGGPRLQSLEGGACGSMQMGSFPGSLQRRGTTGRRHNMAVFPV